MNIKETFRWAKFFSVRSARRVVNPGNLSVISHLMGLRNWLDRARIDLVIDVGGNVGQFSSALRYLGYRGDILTFEPIPDAFAALSHRMRADTHWQGKNIAVGKTSGDGVLNVTRNTVYSSFRSRVTQNKDDSDTLTQRIRIEVQSLESVVEEMNLVTRLPRTLLKSDTQGHELDVLSGLGDHLEKIKLIQCEISSIPLYNGMPFMTDVIAFLDRHHFKAVSFAPVNSDSVRPAEFDYLCVNEKMPC